MAMMYQQGTVYTCGKKTKMWYGKYLVYRKDENGKEVGHHRNKAICPKAGVPKFKAEEKLREMIQLDSNAAETSRTPSPDPSMTVRKFVNEVYIVKRKGKWSAAYRKTNTYQLEHYVVSKFGDLKLRDLEELEIQKWLDGMADDGYSESVVKFCFTSIRAITKMAKKKKYIVENPGEDVNLPLTKQVEKPVMTKDVMLLLLGAIKDIHDLCLLCVGIFCGPRSSEALGLQWKSWTGVSLMPHGTAYEGQFYPGVVKTKKSKAPIPVPELIRPVIEAWRKITPDSSPEALMFPTFGRGERKGQAVPRWGKNFLTWRIRPIAKKLGIPAKLVTFQVMRRTLATELQDHGSMKDAQSILRHASIVTTGDTYQQPIEKSVFDAVNSRTAAVIGDWQAPVESLGLTGRNPKGPKAIRRDLAKEEDGVAVSY